MKNIVVLLVLNNCVRTMGKRTNYNVLNPTTNIDKLNTSYNITEHLLLQIGIFIEQILQIFEILKKLKEN